MPLFDQHISMTKDSFIMDRQNIYLSYDFRCTFFKTFESSDSRRTFKRCVYTRFRDDSMFCGR